MTKSFREIQFETLEFTSDSDYSPKFLYDQILPISKRVDLLLGFFNSSAFNALSKSFSDFILNGGKMRIVTNTEISEEDYKGLFERDLGEVDYNKITNILVKPNALENEFKEYGDYFYECLRFLIEESRLEIKSTIYIQTDGRFSESHSKRIIFFDGQDYIMANGSANFTKTGIELNAEDVTITLGWNDPDPNRITNQLKRFENIISGKHPKYIILPNQILKNLILTRSSSLSQEALFKKRDGILRNLLVNKPENTHSFEATKEIYNFKKTEYVGPYLGLRSPRDYQEEAKRKWLDNDKKGLFTMATGTGKTFTAISCLVHEYHNNGSKKNIIIASGHELIEQWEKEMKEAGFRYLFKWYSKNTRLEKDKITIKDLNRLNELNIVITYQGLQSAEFQRVIGKDLTEFNVVFDEAHRMAGPNFLTAVSKYKFKNVLGLSATPLKDWDESGSNEFILQFFQAEKFGYTFDYSMKEAIDKGFLCPYNYHPYFVHLEKEEWDEYIELSRQIMRAPEGELINKKAAMKRQLLIDQAVSKIPLVIKILKILREENKLKSTLVYCPKGETGDFGDESSERIIQKIAELVRDNFPGLNHHFFTGETNSRDLLLEQFSTGEVDLLYAIKCLDEGVDVPHTRNAIFIASGKNKREYIQRRGRVLRKPEGKELAEIYDIIVIPTLSQFQEKESTGLNMFKNEFKRVEEFLSLARHQSQEVALNIINNVLFDYGLNYNLITEKNEA